MQTGCLIGLGSDDTMSLTDSSVKVSQWQRRTHEGELEEDDSLEAVGVLHTCVVWVSHVKCKVCTQQTQVKLLVVTSFFLC